MPNKKRIAMFIVAGASGALTELLVFNLFLLNFQFLFSKVFSLVIALTLNFTINRTFTFLALSGKIHKQAVKYVLVYMIAVIANISISYFASNLLGTGFWASNLASASGIICAVPITYFGSLLWVFKS